MNYQIFDTFTINRSVIETIPCRISMRKFSTTTNLFNYAISTFFTQEYIMMGVIVKFQSLIFITKLFWLMLINIKTEYLH